MPFRRPLLVLVSAVIGVALAGAQSPKIEITEIPPAGQGGPTKTVEISGTASGPEIRDLRVVCYAYAGNQWWVQPTAANPLSPIDTSNGKWTIDTHLGRNYAALLVRKSYKAPATTDSLPEVGGDVLAIDQVAGKPR
jgi:hypothetical protein